MILAEHAVNLLRDLQMLTGAARIAAQTIRRMKRGQTVNTEPILRALSRAINDARGTARRAMGQPEALVPRAKPHLPTLGG